MDDWKVSITCLHHLLLLFSLQVTKQFFLLFSILKYLIFETIKNYKSFFNCIYLLSFLQGWQNVSKLIIIS